MFCSPEAWMMIMVKIIAAAAMCLQRHNLCLILWYITHINVFNTLVYYIKVFNTLVYHLIKVFNTLVYYIKVLNTRYAKDDDGGSCCHVLAKA